MVRGHETFFVFNLSLWEERDGDLCWNFDHFAKQFGRARMSGVIGAWSGDDCEEEF